MSYKIIEHIPDWIEVGDNYKWKKAVFETEEEFYAIPFVMAWSNPGRFSDREFYRFSRVMDAETGPHKTEGHLIAEFNNGEEWCVVGRIGGRMPWLPEWKAPTKKTVEVNG